MGGSRRAPDMVVRPSARVIALDPAGRVLLFECEEPAARERHDSRGAGRPRLFWVTPGGGVEAGEAPEEAAVRELLEETGIQASALGPCVLEEEVVGRHPDYGDRDIVYRGRIFLVRLTAAEAGRLSPGAVERAGYRTHRWWSLEELELTDEEIAPAELAAILRRALAGS